MIALLAGVTWAQPRGLAERVPNTALVLEGLPAEVPETHALVPAFPSVSAPGATELLQVPGRDELVLVTPEGLRSFSLSEEVPTLGAPWFALDPDEAILTVAFPADWQEGAPAAVSFFRGSADAGDVVVAPFVVGADRPGIGVLVASGVARADAAASLAVAEDGSFHLALGDLGRPSSAGEGERPEGKVLRLDAETLQPTATTAAGLRRPGLAADPVMGTLFATDLGPGGILELNRLAEGLDFGWPEMAGNACYRAGTACNFIGKTRPVWTQTTGESGAYFGGRFSYDPAAPDLHGQFLLGDSASGEIMSVADDGGMFLAARPLEQVASGSLTGMGSDAAGAVYFIVDGGLHVLRPADGVPNPFPTRLSANPGLLAAGLGQDQTAQGVIPYAPSAILWSDGARKERFIALPGTTTIGFREADGWDFPDGALIVKNFILPADERAPSAGETRLETRLLLRRDGEWNGFSYKWNPEQTDAVLLPRSLERPVSTLRADGARDNFNWFYPSRTDCFTCHTPAANFVLGLNTPQMNREFDYPASGVRDNQLRAYETIGLFDAPLPAPPEELDRMPAQHDTAAPLALRARAHMHANCAFCHRPGGGGQIGTDFRWQTPLAEMGILNDRPSGFDLDIEDAYLLLPGHPEQSVVPARMRSLDPAYRMPPLGRERVAEQDLALIEDWIRSLAVAEHWRVY